MIKETPEEREERKKRFIERLRFSKFEALFEPLKSKIEKYLHGETDEEDVLKTVWYVAKKGDDLRKLFKNRTDVILAGISMEENRYVTEINGISVKIRHGSIIDTFADALVIPVSSTGKMEGELGDALKNAGGKSIEEEAISKAPIEIDKPIYTAAGELPLKCIIHVVTTEEGKSAGETALRATKGVLSLAEELECEAIAIPGLAKHSSAEEIEKAAEAIVEAISEHKPESIKDIILIASDESVVDAFESALERYDEQNG